MGILVVTNQKGGTGKSTITVLAAYYAKDKRQQRICVIDLDAQGNTSRSLRDHASQLTSVDLFKAEPIPTLPKGESALVLIASAKGLADIERADPKTALPAFVSHVRAIAPAFDYCLIDTPPALGLRMSAALMAADYVCCPIELEEYSIDGVTDMLKTIVGMRQRYNPSLTMLGIIANRFNAHSIRQKAALEHLLSQYSEFVLPAKISQRSAIPEAIAAGIPPWRLTKSSAREASAEVLHLLDLLWARMQAADDQRREAQ